MDGLNEPLGAALLRRVFKGYFQSDWAALFALRSALRSGVDPFRYCAAQFNLSEHDVYCSAAEALGMVYCASVPPFSVDPLEVKNVDNLKSVASIRGKVLDREVLFIAPSFWRFIDLAKRVSKNLQLRGQICIVPPKALRNAYAQQQANALNTSAVTRLARKWPFASAHLGLSKFTRYGFLVLALAITLTVFFPFGWFQPVATALMAILFLLPAAFRLSCAINGRHVERVAQNTLLSDDDLPIYTVLIPLRDETELVAQLAKSMRALNYPAEKLDIKFVVEATSKSTIEAVKPFLDDIRFELIEVPDSTPRTKPKAVNFALPFARGEHLVIFDAEDIPQRDQLRIAASVFAQHPHLECLQAELVIDNANETPLTAFFATEYAAQFGLILPLLAHLDMPMPLGGTSNHFRTRTLVNLGAWDSFNVTEDADLGIRLARKKLKSAVLPSYTREEAPIEIWSWVKQRTRWMKGWMQTLLVHSRDFKSLVKQIGITNAAIFYIYVGGLVFSAPLHGLFVARFLFDLATQKGFVLAQYSELSIYILVLITGYASALSTAFLGLWHTRQLHLFGWQALLPFYWLLTSFATLRASFQLAVAPFSWEKTTHARTQLPRYDRKLETKPDTPSTQDAKSIYL